MRSQVLYRAAHSLGLRQVGGYRQLAAFAELTSRLAPTFCKVTRMVKEAHSKLQSS